MVTLSAVSRNLCCLKKEVDRIKGAKEWPVSKVERDLRLSRSFLGEEARNSQAEI